MAKISVIVPIYGVEKYLRECLDSIINQTFRDLEIILIDDGGKDNCPQIIDEYAQKDERIIAIHKENGGYGRACNVGLDRASGEYISIIEPDDYIKENMFADLYKIAEEYDSDIVKSGFYDNLQSKNLTRCKKAEFSEDIPTDRSFRITEYPYFLIYHPSIWSCLYRRAFLKKHNIRFAEVPGAGWSDNPFQVQTMCLAERINYTPEAYYYWRRLNENESDDLKDYTIPFKRCDEIHEWLDENNISDENILACLYVRELNYIKIVLGMLRLRDIRPAFRLIKLMLKRMEKTLINENKYVDEWHRRFYKGLSKNCYVYYLNSLRKKIISIKFNRREKSVKVFGNIIYTNDKFKQNGLNNKTINICFASDNNYIQHCAAAISSILVNNKLQRKYSFHILDGRITPKNKEKLLSLRNLCDFDMQFYDMSKIDCSELPLNREYISIVTYYRLFLLDILPQNLDKIIYLDCDLVVEKDLAELWEEDIDNYIAGVVEDEGSITQSERLKLPMENNYFNAGVIVFNLKKLREFGYKEKCFEYYRKNKDIIILQDQDILNGVFNGLCKYLPLKWNVNGRMFRENELEHHYTLNDENLAKKEAGIIHFTDYVKPWQVQCKHAKRNEYFKYLKLTPWKNYISNFKIRYCKYILKLFIQNIFSLKNELQNDKIYKVVRILGLKIKIRNQKRENLQITY